MKKYLRSKSKKNNSQFTIVPKKRNEEKISNKIKCAEMQNAKQ